MLLSMSKLHGLKVRTCIFVDYILIFMFRNGISILWKKYNLVPVESRPVGLIDPSDVPIVRHLGLQASVNISFKIFGIYNCPNYCFISQNIWDHVTCTSTPCSTNIAKISSAQDICASKILIFAKKGQNCNNKKYIFWRPESVQVAQGARREGEAHWRSTQLTARHNTCPPDRTKNKEKLKHNQEKDFVSGM